MFLFIAGGNDPRRFVLLRDRGTSEASDRKK